MKEEKDIFICYVKETMVHHLVGLSCFMMCALVFWLYGIDSDIISYSILLCMMICLFRECGEFYFYRKDYFERKRLFGSIEYNLFYMKKPRSRMEKDYRELLGMLLAQKGEEVKKKEEAYKEIKDYILLWAHQIKTPVTGMNLLLQSAETDYIEDEEAMKRIRHMKEEMFEIELYIGMNLEYIRLDSLNADLMVKECNLEKIIRTEVKHFRQMFIAKKLSIQLDNLERNVITDEKWIAFVIGQILSNAVKYTKKGGIKIWAEEAEKETFIFIEDTGIGIAPEDLPRLFEKAFTGFNGHMEKRSTGIGLYLSKKILGKMGHSIEITSELGKGTCVRIGISNVRYR